MGFGPFLSGRICNSRVFFFSFVGVDNFFLKVRLINNILPLHLEFKILF